MVSAVITASENSPEIKMIPEIYDAMMRLRAFLTEHVYTNSAAKAQNRAENFLADSMVFRAG